MAIGWLTVLKVVPWSDVIRNAPAVADGARKLWGAVARKPVGENGSQSDVEDALSGGELSMAGVKRRLIALDAEVADLHTQMLASTELIQSLAEQNTQLIRRLETNRLRTLWLAAATAILFIALLVLHWH